MDLVYIDPPFASGVDYARKIQLRQHPDRKAQQEEASLLSDADWEQKFYSDIWTKNDYLNWMMENLVAIREVMSAQASIYVHLDWHIGHYVKVLMDEVFGEDKFINEIVWAYKTGGASQDTFQKKHDTIFVYGKTEEKIFNLPKDKSYLSGQLRHSKNKPVLVNKSGEKYQDVIFSKTPIRLYKDDKGYYTYSGASDVWHINAVGRTSKERVDIPLKNLRPY